MEQNQAVLCTTALSGITLAGKTADRVNSASGSERKGIAAAASCTSFDTCVPKSSAEGGAALPCEIRRSPRWTNQELLENGCQATKKTGGRYWVNADEEA